VPRHRKKPLSQLEHGTRIYAPSPAEARYRVVATDAVSGERIFVKCRTEEAACAQARELEGFIAQTAPIRDPHDAGPRTVERLAARYVEDHLSGLSVWFREKQTYLLDVGCCPPRRPHRHRLDSGRLRGGDRRRPTGWWLRRARPGRWDCHAGPGHARAAVAVVDRPERGPDMDGPLR
jgi:hypothetical protein